MFALGSSLGWGVSDFLGGLKSRTLDVRTVLLVSQIASLVLLVAGVVVLAGPPPSGWPAVAAVLAGVGELVGVAALYRGLAIGIAGVVSPASAAAPVVPLAMGLALGDVLTPVRGIALVVLVAGIVLTAIERADERSARSRVPASVGYGILSALGFGCYYVFMDAATQQSRGGHCRSRHHRHHRELSRALPHDHDRAQSTERQHDARGVVPAFGPKHTPAPHDKQLAEIVEVSCSM
jgi:drug/metabolite transporter (DMT)-like permease